MLLSARFKLLHTFNGPEVTVPSWQTQSSTETPPQRWLCQWCYSRAPLFMLLRQMSLYSQHQLFASTSALDSCLASHGYKHFLRLFSWLLPIHSHFKSHLFSWESPLGQDDYGTHGSGYHSFLVLVGKYMPSPLLFASQSGSSHSSLDTQGLAE